MLAWRLSAVAGQRGFAIGTAQGALSVAGVAHDRDHALTLGSLWP